MVGHTIGRAAAIAVRLRAPPSLARPFFVVDRSAVVDAARAWRFALPFVVPCYAVKANADATLLRWLAIEGVGFECASTSELDAAQTAVHAANLTRHTTLFSLYANPVKPPHELAGLVARGVDTTTPTVVDSLDEVDKLRAAGWRGGVLIRIAVPDRKARLPLSRKYGAPPASAPELTVAAAAAGLLPMGVSFHVGSGCADPDTWSAAVRLGVATLRACRSAVPNAECDVVDIGGGFQPLGTDFLACARAVRDAMLQEERDRAHNEAPIVWLAEPGRYFAAASHTLYAPIIGARPDGSVVVDASLYGALSARVYDAATVRWELVRPSDRGDADGVITVGADNDVPRRTDVLWGASCDAIDCLDTAAGLPTPLRRGDWLRACSLGAYSTVSASAFNGMAAPDVLYVD